MELSIGGKLCILSRKSPLTCPSELIAIVLLLISAQQQCSVFLEERRINPNEQLALDKQEEKIKVQEDEFYRQLINDVNPTADPKNVQEYLDILCQQQKLKERKESLNQRERRLKELQKYSDITSLNNIKYLCLSLD